MVAFRVPVFVGISLLTAVGTWASAGSPNAERTDLPFQNELLKAAADYKTWGRRDDQMRWAPTLCASMPKPGMAHLSTSRDGQTHGQKLYSLFVKNGREYPPTDNRNTMSVGQAIVKQSWMPEEIIGAKEKEEARNWMNHKNVIYTPDPKSDQKTNTPSVGDHFFPYASKGTKVYKAARQADLFIMLKLDPKTPGTDEGWVYGTVTPDGQRVISTGKVESCLKCHQQATHDRMLGSGA